MALKSKLTKTEFDALADVLKEHYTVSGDNYLLQSDEATELRAAKQREKERADKLQADKDAADVAKAAADALAAEAAIELAKKNKDVTSLEASWKADKETAVATVTKEKDATIAKLNGQLETLLVDNAAQAIAAEISVSPKLLVPHIRARLKAETAGEKPLTRVLDADGNPTALTLADLSKEFVANADFAAIIKGSGANGGGANGSGQGGGAGKKFQDMTEAERVSLARSNPEGFRAQATAAGVRLP